MNHTQRSRIGLLAITLLAACSLTAFSASAEITAEKPGVKESFGLDGITWQTGTAYKSVTLVVSGADGFRMQENFQAGDTLFLDFASVAKAASPNGQFKYELVFTPFMTAEDKALAEDARALGVEASTLGTSSIGSVFGVFTLESGNIVDVELPETTLKDFVINDDLIVDGSACIGFDCVNGESFGFDTLRLKENNLRIKAQDTSSTASFPTQDWQLTFNDTTNGGQNKFAVECVSPGSSVPFTVEGCAPSHSLYVDDAGRIGLGTNSPVVELHVKDGDSPTLRLEQDGSSGFTPQIWDVAGNETNFFVRDATNGSRLPLRIQPGAPSNSIYVATGGAIGIGTSNPGSFNANDDLHISGNNPARVSMTNTSITNGGDNAQTWTLNSNGTFRIGASPTLTPLALQADGTLDLSNACIELGAFACTASNGNFSCVSGTCP